jgi:hypothetical protein
MSQCMLLLGDLSKTNPAAAASAIAQPMLQLLGPAVKHCLQQQQQQQGAVSPDAVQRQFVERFLELLHTVLQQSE